MRKRLFASLPLLGVLLAGSIALAPVASAAQNESAACTSARSSLAVVTVQRDAAQKAYDDAKADVSTPVGALNTLLNTLNTVNITVGEKQRTVNTECRRVGGNDGGFRNSCADYAREGVFNIQRNDARYRDVLDVDNDGVACERNGDDTRGNDNNRNCKDLRDARDDARTQVNEANAKITESQAVTSAEGANISTSERFEIDQQVREANAAIKKLEDERNDANRRCADGDDDLNVALLPIPGDSNSTSPTTIIKEAPPVSSSASGDGNISSRSVPQGGVETGNGVDTAPVPGAVWLAALASLGVAGSLARRLGSREV